MSSTTKCHKCEARDDLVIQDSLIYQESKKLCSRLHKITNLVWVPWDTGYSIQSGADVDGGCWIVIKRDDVWHASHVICETLIEVQAKTLDKVMRKLFKRIKKNAKLLTKSAMSERTTSDA